MVDNYRVAVRRYDLRSEGLADIQKSGSVENVCLYTLKGIMLLFNAKKLIGDIIKEFSMLC